MIHNAMRRRSRLPAGAAALFLLLAGCASPEANDTENGNPAEPPAASSSSTGAPTPSPAGTTSQAGQTLVMDESKPVSFAIPALERTGDIIETGLREDNTLEVPPDHEGAPASWKMAP